MRRLELEKRRMAERVLREMAEPDAPDDEGTIGGLMRIERHTDDVKTRLIILRRLTREMTAAESLRPRAPASWAVHRVAPGAATLPEVGVVPDSTQRAG